MTPPPAPQLPRLRRLPVPLREPSAASRVRERMAPQEVPTTQGTLALALSDPASADVAPVPVPVLVASGQLSPLGAAAIPGDHHEWAVRFVQAAMEVAAGVRSAAQLVRWTSLHVQTILLRRGALAARAQRSRTARVSKPQLRSLRLSSVRPGVYEGCAVVMDRDRVRAVAFRMEDLDGRWRVTALEIG